MNIDDILQFVPTSYAKYLILLPFIGRAYKAVKNGGGIVGMWKALMFGDHQPPSLGVPKMENPPAPPEK